MKRLLTILMAIALMAAALPAFADTDGYPDNILLENGIPYGNYGFPGLVKLHNGDMNKVDAHMRSARANQQGAGISYRSTTTTSASRVNDLVAQALARLTSMGGYDFLIDLINGDIADGRRGEMNDAIAARLAASEWDSLSDIVNDEEFLFVIFGEL